MMANAVEFIDPVFYLRLCEVKVNFIRHVLYPCFVLVLHLWFFSSAQSTFVDCDGLLAHMSQCDNACNI